MQRETLRRWFIEDEVERGTRPGLTRDERSRMSELKRENRELRRPTRSSRARRLSWAAPPPTEEVGRYIDNRFGVEPICEVLEVAPSTYYSAKKRPPWRRRITDEKSRSRSAGCTSKTTPSTGPQGVAPAAPGGRAHHNREYSDSHPYVKSSEVTS